MFLLIMDNFHKLGFTYPILHLPKVPKVQNSFLKHGKGNKNNYLRMPMTKNAQVLKQVFEWLPCQMLFFRFTDSHSGFRHIYESSKFLSEGRKLQICSIWSCG